MRVPAPYYKISVPSGVGTFALKELLFNLEKKRVKGE